MMYEGDQSLSSMKDCNFNHRQPKLNIREPLNYKDLYGNTTDLCKMVETNIVLRMMFIQESDAGILGKKKSECSYQESNLRPSDY